ncbi:DUF128 domain-containing protein [Chloroflexota bacterium]
MIAQQTSGIERKTMAILKVLSNSQQPLGGRVLARRLADLGIDLGERTVRYHLKLMDERGLTCPVGQRHGRLITKSGIEELDNALLSDRVGLVTTRIETLAYQSCFDLEKRTGEVPINVSLFSKEDLKQVIRVMKDVFKARLGIGDLVAIAFEREKLGGVIIPLGRVGLATLSHIVVCGILLRAVIPVDARFGGILQIKNREVQRFVHLIEYTGCSLYPSEVFIASKMTSVSKAAKEGNGRVLASFCEIPAIARSDTGAVLKELEAAGMKGLVMMGRIGEPLYQIPVMANKFGVVSADGLNPVVAAMEAGIKIENYTMSGTIDFGKLRHFKDWQSIGG